MNLKSGINILSLFDGISCGMVALERAEIKVNNYIAYENDKIPISVSKKNYPNILQMGDVFGADFSQFNNGIDLLLGGSPCTFWSISKRNRETTDDGMGFKLFNRYHAALKETGCKYFLYENNYKIPIEIQRKITEALGVEPIIINSARVSAQKRFRLYWSNIPNIQQPEFKNVYVKDILEKDVEETNLYSLVKFNEKSEKETNELLRIGTIGNGGQGERVYSILGKSVNITANGGGRGAKVGLYKTNSSTVRKLTPIEAERLQTLPDNYTNGISNNQRYKCIGNGWTVDVIAHILKQLHNL